MERSSPPTDRVVRIIGLLAAQPRASFTLSAIARQLDITKATALAIVNTLTADGWLLRDSASKQYTLGPMLIAAGRSAQAAFGVVGAARAEMIALAGRYNSACTATALVDGELVVVERVGPPTPVDAWIQPGQRYPFVAPSGVSTAAWSSDAVVETWLGTANGEAARLRAAIKRARRDGYLIEPLTDGIVRLHQAVESIAADSLPPAMRRALDELFIAASTRTRSRSRSATERSSVGVVSAPVRDANGAPELVLGLYLQQHNLRERDIADAAQAVLSAAERVTASVRGS